MATIEFSTLLCTAVLNFTLGNYSSRGLVVSSSNPQASLRIMKGTLPLDFSEATNGSTSYASDVLITFQNIGNSGTDALNVSTTAGNVFTLNTRLRTASASGTATWFWWLLYNTTSPTSISNQAMGTVGLIGSGADIEIPNVNIISGNPYRISGVKWNIPDGGFTY